MFYKYHKYQEVVFGRFTYLQELGSLLKYDDKKYVVKQFWSNDTGIASLM